MSILFLGNIGSCAWLEIEKFTVRFGDGLRVPEDGCLDVMMVCN